MPRCCWVFAAMALLACCGPSLSPPAYPKTVAGRYRLYHELVLTGDQIPKAIPPERLIRVVSLVYDASNGIQVTVFETSSRAYAREAMDRWQAHDDRYARQIGRYFVLAQAEKPDPQAMAEFLDDFVRRID